MKYSIVGPTLGALIGIIAGTSLIPLAYNHGKNDELTRAKIYLAEKRDQDLGEACDKLGIYHPKVFNFKDEDIQKINDKLNASFRASTNSDISSLLSAGWQAEQDRYQLTRE